MANPSMNSSPGTAQKAQRLEKNVLSVPNGIALAAAAMAPVIAVVLNAPAAGPVALLAAAWTGASCRRDRLHTGGDWSGSAAGGARRAASQADRLAVADAPERVGASAGQTICPVPLHVHFAAS